MPFLKDLVNVADAGIARLRTRAGEIIAGRQWAPAKEQSVVEVKGWVRAFCRERGKIVPGTLREEKVIGLQRVLGELSDAHEILPWTIRDDHNIFTNTGREYLALLSSIQTPGSPGTAYRTDSIAYIGVGTGSQVEDAGVSALVEPIEYLSSEFLAALDAPPTFPLSPSRTTARYHRTFLENEITLSPGTVNITELGLYTNGDQDTWVPGDRDTTFASAADQSPIAYKTIEPIPKTDTLQFEVYWEIRY